MGLDEIQELLEIEDENIALLLRLKNEKGMEHYERELIREQLKFNLIKMRSLLRVEDPFGSIRQVKREERQ